MAEAVVEFLLENLKQLLEYNVNLISGLKEEVQSLYWDLSLLNALIKDYKAQRSQYEVVKEIVKLSRDVAYDAEDIIDTYLVNAAMHKTRSRLIRMGHSLDSRSVAKKIKFIKTRITNVLDKYKFGFEFLRNGETSTRRSPQRRAIEVEADNVVGFNEEANTVINQLITGTEELAVISVVGMGGLGKATFAHKVYTDASIQNHFPIRAWVNVSQDYSMEQVFLTILGSLRRRTDEMDRLSGDRLKDILREYLCGGKYLIVIDDVWDIETWDNLKEAFPKIDCGSRILLTSRNMYVASHANPLSPPHQLRFLTGAESWELLKKKVFGTESCPSRLEELGNIISEKCYGLPLAIVVIAEILRETRTPSLWKRVADSFSTYVARDPQQCVDYLALSYYHLPDHLKICFLYLGVFPEDFTIPVWKLLRLWVAEGFIPQQTGQESMEDVAEKYLEDLVARNLVSQLETRANGRLKTCKIHGMLRDLCLREGKEEKFFKVIELDAAENTEYHRRLCIHSHVLDYVSLRPCDPRVRSFLSFAKKSELPSENISFIHKAFKLVRVLDVRSIHLHQFPTDIIRLVHLRYLAVLGNIKILPKSICKLWNLQTLIVETTEREMDIQVDIWKMLHFRHLHTTGSSRLHGPPPGNRKHHKNPFLRGNVQTISTVSPKSCTENMLARTLNLKKLGIRGKLITLMEENGGRSMFDYFVKLGNLETLKLLNDTNPLLPFQVKLERLPESNKFPPNLKKLTLSNTFLEWKHMSTIGKLPYLEILKLKENAFMGQHWESLDGGFDFLGVLQLGKTDLVQWDTASSHHFPSLERVVLKDCEKLGAIPSSLGDVSALKIIELYSPTTSLLQSAQVIQQQKQHSMVNNGFKLLVH